MIVVLFIHNGQALSMQKFKYHLLEHLREYPLKGTRILSQ